LSLGGLQRLRGNSQVVHVAGYGERKPRSTRILTVSEKWSMPFSQPFGVVILRGLLQCSTLMSWYGSTASPHLRVGWRSAARRTGREELLCSRELLNSGSRNWRLWTGPLESSSLHGAGCLGCCA